jgi:preprotein translocase subunit SecD
MTDIESRLTAALTDTAHRNLPDATVPPPFRPVPERASRRVRPWALPALAAAVVVAVTVSAVALVHRGRPATHRVPADTAPGLHVTLRARTPLSAAELDRARQVIIARAVALGAQGGEVQVVGSHEITAVLPGLAASDVADLGAVGDLQLRPVVIGALGPPPRPGGAQRTVDPFSSLGFPPPTDTAAWRALSIVQQNAVRAMLEGWDCANTAPDPADAPTVVCEPDGTGQRWKWLLGPAIVTSKDVQSAAVTVTDPQPAYPSSTLWQLSVNLKAAAQQQWTSYTAQHNARVHPNDPNAWVAIVDGKEVQSHSTPKAVNGAPAIWYTEDQQSAIRLAANLTGGVLPAPFDVVSVSRR